MRRGKRGCRISRQHHQSDDITHFGLFQSVLSFTLARVGVCEGKVFCVMKLRVGVCKGM